MYGQQVDGWEYHGANVSEVAGPANRRVAAAEGHALDVVTTVQVGGA